jgi:hypothetical protein
MQLTDFVNLVSSHFKPLSDEYESLWRTSDAQDATVAFFEKFNQLLKDNLSPECEIAIEDMPKTSENSFNEFLVHVKGKLTERFGWETPASGYPLIEELVKSMLPVDKGQVEETMMKIYEKLTTGQWALTELFPVAFTDEFIQNIGKIHTNEFFKLLWMVKFEDKRLTNQRIRGRRLYRVFQGMLAHL